MPSIAVGDLPVSLDGAPENVLTYPSLISHAEKALLYQLARNYFTGEGTIVDAGIFLGASTNAFGIGLRDNPTALRRIPPGRKPITSYDLAIFVESMRRYIGRDAFRAAVGNWSPAPGESFEPILRALLAEHADLVEIRIGDLAETAHVDGPVEIAFFDCLKSEKLDRVAFNVFAPHYIPGRTIVVQQDYFYAGAPEHRLRQESLSDHFHYLGQIDTAAIFRLDTPIPGAMHELDPLSDLSLTQELRLFDQAVARTPFRLSKLAVRLSAAAHVRRRHGAAPALELKREIEREFSEELPRLLKGSPSTARAWRTLAS